MSHQHHRKQSAAPRASLKARSQALENLGKTVDIDTLRVLIHIAQTTKPVEPLVCQVTAADLSTVRNVLRDAGAVYELDGLWLTLHHSPRPEPQLDRLEWLDGPADELDGDAY